MGISPKPVTLYPPDCGYHQIQFTFSRMSNAISTRYNFTFWLHLALTLFSWTLPFVVDWKLAVAAYVTVLMQFVLFNACLMNRGHALNDDGDDTFYAHLLEIAGIRLNRKKVKTFVRFWKYILLAALAILWQPILGNDPLFLKI
jgi:hypothetical protein